MQLTVTETWWLEECALAESLAVHRAAAYEQITADPQLRQLCHEVEQVHRSHVNLLAGAVLGPAGPTLVS